MVPSPHVVILLVKVTELVDDGAVVGERVAGGGVQGELNERRVIHDSKKTDNPMYKIFIFICLTFNGVTAFLL